VKHNNKPIRLIELFAGIGSQAKALENLEVNFEHYKVVEFDKYAISSYNAIHGTDFETSDITQICGNDLNIEKTDEYDYLMTYSFPCQDLSIAGSQKGMSKGGNTRSGLLWQVERLLNESFELPQMLLMENVPQVISKKNIGDFTEWQKFLEAKGYTNYLEILNSKDYGIPQNRKRCFMVSILNDNRGFEFPKPFQLEKKISDILEDNVDDSYYVDTPESVRIGDMLRIKQATKQGFIDCPIGGVADFSYPNSETRRGRVQGGGMISPTITATTTNVCKIENCNDINVRHTELPCILDDRDKGYGVKTSDICPTQRAARSGIKAIEKNYRIRRLAPLECWKLMGFDESDYNKAATCNSKTQLYKQAGNSIVVDVLENIFRKLVLSEVS